MSNLELTGTVKRVGTEETFASGFQKREMVILTEEQYPQPINIEFLQDKIDLIDNCKEGDKVTVHINVRGREWTSPQGEVKYFNSITGWRVEKLEGGETKTKESVATEMVTGKKTATLKEAFLDDDDDLGF